MDRRRTVTRRRLLLAGTLLPAWGVLAQQAKLFRIGVLETTPIEGNANFESFRRRLSELGYQNVAFEYRSSYGRNERFKELAVDLVRLKVDLILTRGTPASLAAKSATRTIPIVMTATSDPVRTGLVESLARPGANVTGFEPFASELQTKRLELIKQVLPGISKVGVMQDMTNPVNPPLWPKTEAAARSRGIEVQLFDVRTADDVARAFEAAAKQRMGAVMPSIELSPSLRSVVQLAAKHRVPAVYGSREFVEAGGFMSYATDYQHLYVRAANYVDQIFKGAKAGDLPVEQPAKFELVINLKTAKALGITIPQPVLLRADRVIE